MSRPVAIVTGASSGIGRAVAIRLASTGATVVVAARRADELSRLVDEIEAAGGRAVAVPTDVRDPEQIAALVQSASAVEGRIDALVNVAGIGGLHSVESDDADVVAMIDVNLVAAIRLMREVIPAMRAKGRGSIINIGSIAGEIGVQGVYSATKFGLRGITDSVRRELGDTGIRVTLIEPGYIATPMTAGMSGRMPGPEIVADAVVAAIRRPRRRMIVPAKARVTVLFATSLPAITDRLFKGTVRGEK